MQELIHMKIHELGTKGYLYLAEQNAKLRMKQSNSASINFTIIYIVKEHRHILLYFYTHHLAHIDYKIRRIALSNCYPGCCMLIVVCFCYTLYCLIYDPLSRYTWHN